MKRQRFPSDPYGWSTWREHAFDVTLSVLLQRAGDIVGRERHPWDLIHFLSWHSWSVAREAFDPSLGPFEEFLRISTEAEVELLRSRMDEVGL